MRRFHSRPEVILVKKTSALLVLALLVGCKKEEPKVEPAPVKPPEPVKAPPKQVPAAKPKAPPLTEAQNAGIKAAFDGARALIKQADALKSQGDMLVKTGGPAAANDVYVKAKQLYHDAVGAVSDWCDGDLGGKVTDAQLKDYLGDYVNELSRWQKSMSELGKIHKDD